MSDKAPKKIWTNLTQTDVVDVSDGRIVKAPGTYYVHADLVDELLAAAKDLVGAFVHMKGLAGYGHSMVDKTALEAITKVEGREFERKHNIERARRWPKVN